MNTISSVALTNVENESIANGLNQLQSGVIACGPAGDAGVTLALLKLHAAERARPWNLVEGPGQRKTDRGPDRDE